MSDTTSTQQENANDDQGMNPDDLAALRKRAEEARKLEKENAFLRHGIKTDAGVGKLFYESYKGDLDIDSIRAAADEYGFAEDLFGAAPAAAAEPERQEQPMQQNAQPVADDPRQTLSAGGFVPAGASGPADPLAPDVGWQEYQNARMRGEPVDVAMSEVIGRTIDRAVEEQRGQR